MKSIKIDDKKFRLFITSEKILSTVKLMARKINKDMADKSPVFVCILNGSFIFAADLLKHIDIITSKITFLRVSSYEGIHSSGNVKQLVGINEDIEGKTVVILEDIVDTGLTINMIRKQLREKKPERILTAALLFKPSALKEDVVLDYVGMEIPNDFIVGYGLDYNGYGRNLRDIYSIINE
jgi:hypoxanthine phosphoribosyltransferase